MGRALPASPRTDSCRPLRGLVAAVRHGFSCLGFHPCSIRGERSHAGDVRRYAGIRYASKIHGPVVPATGHQDLLLETTPFALLGKLTHSVGEVPSQLVSTFLALIHQLDKRLMIESGNGFADPSLFVVWLKWTNSPNV